MKQKYRKKSILLAPVVLAVAATASLVFSLDNANKTKVEQAVIETVVSTTQQTAKSSQPATHAAPQNQQDKQKAVAASQKTATSYKTAQGSLITTSNVERVKTEAAKNNLTIEAITSTESNQSIVRLAQSTDHSGVAAIKDEPFVSSVATNYTYRALYTLTNPDTYYSNQWNITKISAPQAWDISTGSTAATIAVIDTGVLFSQSINGATYSQPDFPASKLWTNNSERGTVTIEGPVPNCTSRGLVLDKQCNNLDDDTNGKVDDWQGWDFMGGFNGATTECPNYSAGVTESAYIYEDNDAQPYSCDSPTYPSALNKTHFNGTCEFGVSACYIGHGTMVASAAASATNNGQLVAGVDHNAKVMNLRVLDGYGYTTTDRVAAAVRYASRNGAHVINMSLAVSDCSTGFVDSVLESAMAEAKAKGVVIVAASGNESISSVCYPASSPHAIAVGASDQNDNRASFSNYGPQLDVVAPGVGIPVANAPSNAINSLYYPTANGTSLATPHVAGLAGLIKAVRPNASADEVRRLIAERADAVPAMGGSVFTREFGYGRINTYTTLRVALGIERPVYQLTNPSTGCRLLTSNVGERDIANAKRGYRYQGIHMWQTRVTNSQTHEAHATTSTCN